ncbi:MAG: thermonuclease family protein [Smithellaceae bacterium]|nr:thermonuclease family protein [Smithellaceae bacterium]
MTALTLSRKLILTAVFLAVLVACTTAAADENVRVRKVIDGDTIQLVDGRKVRLLGINAPEKREPYNQKAKRFVESRVSARDVRLEYDQEREDAYGRLLAYVHAGRSLLNEQLVREGLAHVMTLGANRKHEQRLLAAQGEAKKKRRALWSVWTRAKTLKITSVHPYHPARQAAYIRVACLADKPLQLAGHVLLNEAGNRFVFPQFVLAPGYSVIVSASSEGGGVSQGILHWPGIKGFNEQGDTAFLQDSAGNVIDQFPYSQRRPGNRKTDSYRKGNISDGLRS